MPATQPDELGQTVDQVAAKLAPRLGNNMDNARELAELVIDEIRALLGPGEVYIRQPRLYDPEKVLADFTGDNAAEVIAEHRISRATLYRLLNRRRRRRG